MDLEVDPQETASLKQLAQSCAKQFRQIAEEEETREASISVRDGFWASRQSAEFNQWCSKIGVNLEGLRSIDMRLKDVPEICELLLQLLQSLHRDLSDLSQHEDRVYTLADETGDGHGDIDSASDASSLSFESLSSSERSRLSSIIGISVEPGQGRRVELRQHISDTLDRLQGQARRIERAGAQHRRLRVEIYREKERPKYMYEGFKKLGMWKANNHFKSAPQIVKERMAESFARRRIRFEYLKEHQRKRAVDLPILPEDGSAAPPEATTSHTDTLAVQKKETPKKLNISGVAYPQYQRTLFSETVNTRYDLPPERKREARAESVRSIALKHPEFPPPPQIVDGRFQCPYCLLEFRDREAEPGRWSQHVMQDFEPYFCTVEGCQSPFDIPNSFDDLLDHLQSHIPVRHHVDEPDGEHREYLEEEFEHHVKNHGEVTEETMTAMKEASRWKSAFLFQSCPFCGGYPDVLEKRFPDLDTLDAQKELRKHIKQHMQEIALFLPPYRPDMFDKDDDLNGSDVTHRQSNNDVVSGDLKNFMEYCNRKDCDCKQDGKYADVEYRWTCCNCGGDCRIARDTGSSLCHDHRRGSDGACKCSVYTVTRETEIQDSSNIDWSHLLDDTSVYDRSDATDEELFTDERLQSFIMCFAFKEFKNTDDQDFPPAWATAPERLLTVRGLHEKMDLKAHIEHDEHLSLATANDAIIMELMLQLNTHYGFHDPEGLSGLWVAAQNGRLDVVRQLLVDHDGPPSNALHDSSLAVNAKTETRTGPPSAFTRPASFLATLMAKDLIPSQARAREHPIRQPRGPPSLVELKERPNTKHKGSKNFATRQRRQAVGSLVHMPKIGQLGKNELDLRYIQYCHGEAPLHAMKEGDRTEGFFNDRPVWIEWKLYDHDAQQLELTNQRNIENHVTVLQHLYKTDQAERYRIPTCLGYVKERKHSLCGFVFEKPRSDSVDHMESVVSLRDLLDRTDVLLPPLFDRIQLMCILYETITHFHANGYVYDGIRPESILFLRSQDSIEGSFAQMFMSGTAFSGIQVGDDMPEPHNKDPRVDIYHDPTVLYNHDILSDYKFDESHDLYSLGIVFLEISHWDPIDYIMGFDLTRDDERELKWVKQRLSTDGAYALEHARNVMGRTVEGVIRAFIEGVPNPSLFDAFQRLHAHASDGYDFEHKEHIHQSQDSPETTGSLRETVLRNKGDSLDVGSTYSSLPSPEASAPDEGTTPKENIDTVAHLEEEFENVQQSNDEGGALSSADTDPSRIKSILKKPTSKFAEYPGPIREGVSLSRGSEKGSEIHASAPWTKIHRKLVNPAALMESYERFEERQDYVIVLRVLNKAEIMKLAERTREIREGREEGISIPADPEQDIDIARNREVSREQNKSRDRRSQFKGDYSTPQLPKLSQYPDNLYIGTSSDVDDEGELSDRNYLDPYEERSYTDPAYQDAFYRPSSSLARDKRFDTGNTLSRSRQFEQVYMVDNSSHSAKLVAERDVDLPRRRGGADRVYSLTSGGRSYHPSSNHSSRLTDLIDGGYSYTDPESMYRDTEPVWRRASNAFHESNIARKSAHPLSPPPSIRGFDRINAPPYTKTYERPTRLLDRPAGSRNPIVIVDERRKLPPGTSPGDIEEPDLR
ncbi:Nn.00g060550.m01.CDS01 [Neocucurbitaria sp. VM-36]